MRIDSNVQTYAVQERQGPRCPVCGQRMDQCSCQSVEAVGSRPDAQVTAPVVQQQAEAASLTGALGFASEMASRLYQPLAEVNPVLTNAVSPRKAAEVYENRAREHSIVPARISRVA